MIIDTIRVVIACLFLSLLILDPVHAQVREVRIGIYQNPPKVFIRHDGTPAGFIVEIMNEIAAAEKWDAVYVFGTWEENLLRLRRGDLDLLLDVTHTADRSRFFDFNSVPVIESWLQVFTTKNKKIESMKDLEGLRIAVLRSSHQHRYFDSGAGKRYGIRYTLVDCPDYQGTVDALRSGEADVIVADRFFYFSPQRGDDIVPAPVIIDPLNILFAFPMGGDRGLVAAVDRRLSSMKNDPESAYYRILQKSLSMKLPPVIPRYIFIVIGIIVAMALFLGVAASFLRMRVAKKTRELLLQNVELEETRVSLESALGEAENAGNALRLALKQKEVLLSELFHRTKNNMQVISSLLTLQAEGSGDPVLRGGILDAVNRIRAMSMVHERLDQVKDLSRIDLGGYLHDLAVHLRSSLGFTDAEAVFEFDMEPVTVLIDYAIPCGLIINELLTNSFKHAFPGKAPGGIISLSLGVQDDSVLRIVYRDNGIGFKDAGTVEATDSIGMKIVRGITEHQLNGSVLLSGENGFTCTISFRMTGYRERV